MFQTISAGVYRMSLPHPALYATNVYLIDGERPILIDGGHFFPAAQHHLTAALHRITAGVRPDLICLTDATPERVGFALSGLAVAADPGLLKSAADYGAFSLLYRRELVLPVFEDAHAYRRFTLEDLQAAINQTYGVSGTLRLEFNAAEGASWDLGGRKLYAIPAPGTSATHVCYWLEPDGFLFSGDIGYAQGMELPPMIRGLGADIPNLLQSIIRLRAMKPARVLPATGEPVLDPILLLKRSERAAEQLLFNIQGMLSAGPRELVRLLDLINLGDRLSPVRLVNRLSLLRVALAALAAEGVIDEIYDDRVFSYRLSSRALRARRRAA
jgi:glyoxylase-like metal-dependent hydrolase (beta-lactamase superfamily II)